MLLILKYRQIICQICQAVLLFPRPVPPFSFTDRLFHRRHCSFLYCTTPLVVKPPSPTPIWTSRDSVAHCSCFQGHTPFCLLDIVLWGLVLNLDIQVLSRLSFFPLRLSYFIFFILLIKITYRSYWQKFKMIFGSPLNAFLMTNSS